MYHALGNALAVKALQFLDQLHILQQHRAIGSCSLRVLVVTYRGTVVASQRGGMHGKGQQAGGDDPKRAAMGKSP